MSVHPESIASRAGEAAADALWRQWAVLGAPLAGGGPEPRAVIDPEATLLLSLAVRGHERRLDDVLAWWAEAGAHLVSVQRLTSLARRFPPAARAGVGAFAGAALAAGDTRWSRQAAESTEVLSSRGKRGRQPRLTGVPPLMLRLRAGFGVGVRADVLAVLLAFAGEEASAPELAAATGYTVAGVRRTMQEMEAARIVRAFRRRPATYSVDLDRWTDFLALGELRRSAAARPSASWAYFDQVFSFLAATLEWAGAAAGASAYLAATRARDVFEAHRRAFEMNRIEVPDPSDFPGPLYLEAFGTTIDVLSEWLRDNL